jgi:hypothetical protein
MSLSPRTALVSPVGLVTIVCFGAYVRRYRDYIHPSRTLVGGSLAAVAALGVCREVSAISRLVSFVVCFAVCGSILVALPLASMRSAPEIVPVEGMVSAFVGLVVVRSWPECLIAQSQANPVAVEAV